MKSKIFIPLIFSCLAIIALADSAKQSTMGIDIVPGVGYSRDTQQISTDVCFDMQTTSTTGQQGVVSLDTATSFADLQDELHIDVTMKGGVGQFSANAEAHYFRSIQDTSYALSLNYYQYLFNTVNMQTVGMGLNALNARGRDIYNNYHKLFGVKCGDNYINTYKQGALLLMALDIKFNSQFEKQRFQASAGGGFANLVSAAGSIERIASANHINGRVIIKAFQNGGDPSRLANILSADPGGNYYALSCDLQNMGNCKRAADGLLNYAKTNFSTQISFVPPTKGLVPLSKGFASFQPISRVGLTAPDSLVTPAVIQNRNYLADALAENQYYQGKLTQLLYGYPVPWDQNSNLYKTSQTLLQNVVSNFGVLRNENAPQDGALGCFDFPEECSAITQSLQRKLKWVRPEQLAYLNQFSKVVNFWGTVWYQTNDAADYFMAPSPAGYYSGRMVITDNAINNINLHFVSGDANPDDRRWINAVGTLSGANNSYSGTLCVLQNGNCFHHTFITSPNPFSFVGYQPGSK